MKKNKIKNPSKYVLNTTIQTNTNNINKNMSLSTNNWM